MAEVLERINELRALPVDQHLFCPRDGDDASVYYDEDVANLEPEKSPDALEERKDKIRHAEERKWLALEALTILAFDGDDAKPHQEWLKERFHTLMTSCDVCVRVFHQSRSEWKAKLLDTYEEDVVPDFLNKVDKLCNERITAGLDEANRVLSAVEPKQRSVRILPNEATYAFFEALSCDAFIRNEELMQRHFDQPFQFVQTKKRLKLQIFLPAMTQFLFSKNEERQTWGILSWTGSKRNILLSEFDWTVRDHLVNAMMRVQTDNLDQAFLGTFWQGVKLIVAKLDKELISHSIRGLDGNFYKLILDHLWLNSEGFLDLVTTMTMLLEKAPTDFWDAMGAVTPRTETIVEQFFKSPILRKLLLAAGDDSEEQQRYLNDAFAWILPFLRSLKPQNLTPVCKAFANFFLDHAQSEPFPKAAKVRCFKECLGVLDYSFRKMNEGKTVESFVGQPNVNGMLTVLSGYIKPIVAKLSGPGQLQPSADIRQLVVSIVLQAFTLECQSLAVERYLISRDKPSPTEPLPSSPIWKAILEAVDADSIDLATNLLVAGRNLIGLEPLHMKTGVKEIPPAVRRFNERFELLSRSVTNVIDRLAEFDPAQLDALLEQPAASSAIISSLFSSTIDTRNSSVELLKVISAQDERRDALQHVLKAYYKNVLKGVSNSCRQITDKKAFAAAPGVVKTCTDIIDVMCNSQDGILRSRSLDTGEAGVTMNLWKSLWDTLSTIFQTTEAWSNLGFYNKTTMMDFCRDTMQFADQLFDQYSIFSTALKEAGSVDETSGDELMKELLAMPAKTMQAMAGWLRLRDEFLSSKSVTLISKLLVRLRQVSVEVDDQALSYMEKVVSGDVRAKLSMQQMAELIRALETYVGHSLAKTEEPVKQSKQGTLAQWASTSTVSAGDRARGHEAARGTTLEKMLAAATPAARAFQDNREARRVAEAKSARLLDKQKEDYQSEFKKKRQAEQERLKKEREAAKARAQKNRGVPSHLAEAGSGLEGLGILGKDRAEKGEGLMHSSDESEDEDGDIDEELFGIKTEKKVRTDPKTNIIDGIKIQMPTKKRKVQRSSMDMRARLAPDLSSLHRTILGWDYFHNGDFPPKSSFNYTKVPGTFRTPTEYQNTFEPLLVLEAWQGFVKAREENTLKPFEIRVVSRASVDAFQEVGSTMTHKENSDVGRISEGDIVLLSQTGSPSVEDRYCLARVFRTQRKQAHYEVSYRVMPGTSLQPALVPNGTVYGTKIQSITPLEREFGALVGLQFYDLCDEIIHAKPSPLLTYKDNQLDPLSENYNLNKAQARAVKSAIDNDAFTLIQGPPGSGKTKTITAIVGALLSKNLDQRGTFIEVPGQQQSSSAAKKLLVCAPSNAAVDELVMRFKTGIKTLTGQERKLNIVRIGRGDAVNANVKDVTLEELVNKQLGLVTSNKNNDAEATRKIFEEHKQISEQLRMVRGQMDSGLVKGPDAVKLQADLNTLRQQKALLGTKIDNAKDMEKVQSRDADINRKKAQQRILGDAHVICATLSGSGNEMFQGLSVEFETVIVDEAAQCVEMSALIPLKYGCSRCILVGDPKQLPPTVFSKQAAKFQYEQSLFVRMQSNHPNDVHLLDTQYRMHPEISLFPSQTFYDGRLLDGGNMAGLRKRPWHVSSLLGPYRFFDVQGQQQAAPKGHSLINIAEINIALALYKRLTADFHSFNFKGKIGIITPYKSQLSALKERFGNVYGPSIVEDVEFNTTDAFQGRESEVIIFSCVRASPAGGIGFLQDIRRMNVGLTRAKSSLWVLGNSQSLSRGEFWNKLLEDAKRRDRFTAGNVLNMLSKHSNAFPAPVNNTPMLQEILERPQTIEEEPNIPSMSHTPVDQSNSGGSASKSAGIFRGYIKQEIKTEIKQEAMEGFGKGSNGKRKLSLDEDVEMVDADADGDSEAASNSNTVSRQSTPASAASAPKVEATTANAPDMDPLAKMTNPKIRRKRPKEANLFMAKRPKKS